MPVLKKHQFPFAFFVNTQSVGSTDMHLNWQQINEMKDAGAEILNHSHTHSHLNRLKKGESSQEWEQRVKNELNTAQQQIAFYTGQNFPILAYPYGEYNNDLLSILDAMGYAALGQQSGPAGMDMPLTLLPRFPMGGHYGKKTAFIEKLNTLPMPLAEYPQPDPITRAGEQPVLLLAMKSGKYATRHLTCYVSGQSPAQIKLDDDNIAVMIQSKQGLKAGRNRYNCTMPAVTPENERQRYYWFSQSWFTLLPDKSWYAEY